MKPFTANTLTDFSNTNLDDKKHWDDSAVQAAAAPDPFRGWSLWL